MLMMLGDDKKKLSQAIAGKIMAEEPDMQEAEADYGMAKEAAMDKFASALGSKDAKVMAEALQEFMDLCSMDSESESGLEIEIEPKES